MNQEKTPFTEGVNNKSNDPILDELEDIENIIQKCPKCYDRLKMLEVLSGFNPPPESIPINKLMPMPGTPLEGADPVDTFDVARTIACARIAVPGAKVRLSAGRTQLSEEAQALCFFAGANSIFYGDKLLTAANPQTQQDLKLLEKLGMKTQAPNRQLEAPATQPQRPLSPSPA